MRLVIDLQTLQGPSADRGIGYYALSLALELATSRPDHQVMALLDGGREPHNIARVRHRLSSAFARDDVVVFPALPSGSRGSAQAQAEVGAAREATIAALAPDAVLITGSFELGTDAPMTIGGWIPAPPTAVVLHDLIPLMDLDHYKPDPAERRTYLRTLEQLKRADALLTNSDFSAEEARRLLDPCPDVSAIYGAAPKAATSYKPNGAPEPGFLLAVAQAEPRKDVPTAVQAWGRVPAEVRAGRPLVIVGAWSEPSQRRLRSLAREVGLPAAALVFAGAVDDSGLAWLYENASLMLFPSKVEGLGLPPLQAMQVATPALLSRSSSLRELVDDTAPYFTTGDSDELSQLIARSLTDADFHQHLLALAARSAARFTWARTAELAWTALEELARRPVPDVPRSTLALVGAPAAEEPGLAESLRPSYDVTVVGPHELDAFRTDSWRFDRILYDLRGDPDPSLVASMADAPGVAVLGGQLGSEMTLEEALAPALGVIVPSDVQVSRLLQAGVTSMPLRVAAAEDASPAVLGEAVEEAYRTDFVTRWAECLGGRPVSADWEQILLRRPRWSVGNGRHVLATDITLYRATPFLSGIQRAVARLHHSLRDLAHDRQAELVPTLVGQSPEGNPHVVIAEDPVLALTPAPVAAADWLLALDYNPDLVAATEQILHARAQGVPVAVNVYDLLPHTNPEWFPSTAADGTYRPWLRGVLELADVVLVNSLATARELERFVGRYRPTRPDSFAVHLLRLGADFDKAEALPTERDERHFLLVGTVEPRKGHRAVLAAFERLWAAGSTARLTVVGRPGWMVDDVVERMEGLRDTQPAFRWLTRADDIELDLLYRKCSAAIVASEGEGFGLPVVEAAIRGCPVIVRDIPVLREIAGEQACYFDEGLRPLAAVVADVSEHPERLGTPSLDSVHNWHEVAARLLDVLAGVVAPVARWSPEAGWASG